MKYIYKKRLSHDNQSSLTLNLIHYEKNHDANVALRVFIIQKNLFKNSFYNIV